jgi:sirohydrochlorin cobaltochelatase
VKHEITNKLAAWLDQGGSRIGEVLIGGRYELQHKEDAGLDDLEVFTSHEAALQIALHDEAGEYRPLRTAPNLRRGWKLELKSVEEVRLALDYFYPAMLGTWCAFQREEVLPLPLRETLGRQTGMYAVTTKISGDEARGLGERFCSGCLKKRLWSISRVVRPALGDEKREWPMLCAEACTLFIEAARNLVKKRPS